MLIVSHDGFNTIKQWQSIIVIPLSTSINQARRGPTAIFLPKGSGGLKESSIALCHQVTTLDRSKLTDRIGTLSREALKEIESGLCAALAITSP